MGNALFSSGQRALGPASAWRYLSITFFLVSLLIACLSSFLLFSSIITTGLISLFVAFGLDLFRAQFVTALLLTAGIALVGAFVGRHKAGAILGAVLAFGVDYLEGFIRLELQPFRGPGGQLEVLNGWALAHTSLMMIALALLCAFIGAATGVAFAETLLNPPLRLLKFTWQRIIRTDKARSTLSEPVSANRAPLERSRLEMVRSWLGVIVVLVSLVLASGSGDLFLFSPDIGLHVLPASSSRNGLPTHGTIVEDSLVSPALGGEEKSFLVYLPPSYNTSLGRTKRYPTLYLLHGSPGGESDWFKAGKADQSADTLIVQGKIPELIMILPDGNGWPGETSEWGNSADGRQLIETYVATDLVNYVDRKYRTIADPAYRGIGGLSMGGFGAANIAIHHPDIFGFMISLGGYYHAEGTIWGKNETYIQANSPANVLPHDMQAWSLHMYIGAATKDQPYYTDAVQFVQELKTLHIRYYIDVEQGYHALSVWQTQLYKALLWLAPLLEQRT